jgi:hypothetical protein
MDSQAFDRLTVSLATGHSRRVLLRRLVGGAIGLAAIRASTGRTLAQSCAGIQESCAELDCCFGYGCDENNVCIAAAECADFGEGCLADEQCCGAYFCGEAGTCIAAAECAGLGQVCKIDENCCDGLVCDDSGACTNPAGDDDGSEGMAAKELPGTGVGSSAHDPSSTIWLAGVAAAAAGAGLIGGSRLRAQPVRQPTSGRIDDRREGVS